MEISRREFLIAGSAGVMAASLPVEGAASPALEIEIIGLNAYVFPKADPAAVLVGFMGAAHGSSAAAGTVNKKMRLRAAPPGAAPAGLFTASPGSGETVITLEGYRTRIEATSGGLTSSRSVPSKPSQAHPGNPDRAKDWKPLHWVPNMSWFATAPKIASHWESKVAGILELRGGTIEAGMPAHEDGRIAIWAFENNGTSVWKQSIADRIVYRLRLDSPDVTLHQTPLTTGAATSTKLRANGTLRIVVDYPDSAVDQFYPVGTTLDHFKAFYSLLDDQSQPVILPVHRADSRKPRIRAKRPGPYCPPTVLEA